jgi:flagellar protein FliS
MSYPGMGYTPTARPMTVPPRPAAAAGAGLLAPRPAAGLGTLAPRPAVGGAAVGATPLAARTPSAAAASPYAAQASRYREAELASAPPGQLVVMLFEKMVLTLRRAQAACEAKQVAERCDLIMKAMDMVTELRGSLDHDQGGEISGQLDALYAFMLRELREANRRQDPARIATVTKIANELREAFAGAVQQLAVAAPPAALSA